MTTIERAARALCKLDGYDPDQPHRVGFQTAVSAQPVQPPPLWHTYVEKVRVVLAALEGPDD